MSDQDPGSRHCYIAGTRFWLALAQSCAIASGADDRFGPKSNGVKVPLTLLRPNLGQSAHALTAAHVQGPNGGAELTLPPEQVQSATELVQVNHEVGIVPGGPSPPVAI